jgi:DNA-binding response OmpR family regulator
MQTECIHLGNSVYMSTTKQRVLVADDEEGIREILVEMLKDEFDVKSVSNGRQALDVLQAFRPHVILADIMMPIQDGFHMCKELRDASENRPVQIIMVSAYNDETTRTKAFEVGADDFIGKPFNREELLARIRSKVNRAIEGQAAVKSVVETLTYGNLSLNVPKMEVCIDAKPIHLSVLEFNLLKYFLDNAETVLSRKQILDNVWSQSTVTDRTVDTHIAGLRKKLNGFDRNIHTIYGAGYVLKA